MHDAEPLAQRRGPCVLHCVVGGSDITRQMLSIWRMSREVGANQAEEEVFLKRSAKIVAFGTRLSPKLALPQTFVCDHLLPCGVSYMMSGVVGQWHGLLLLELSPSSSPDVSRE